MIIMKCLRQISFHVMAWILVLMFLGIQHSLNAQILSKTEAVLLKTSTGTLSGTLQLPPLISQEMTCVLIIAGSGPTDRDGNSTVLQGKNNSLKMLAEELAQSGFASLRYDKRGIGASKSAMVKEEDLRFEDYVQDAESWIRQIRTDTRFRRVVVVGHSEGSLIGMIAARKTFANGFISIAGAGFSADEVIKKQISAQPIPENFRQDIFAKLDSVKQGKVVLDVPPMLMSLFRPSVQPYMHSWMRYNPQTEIAQLNAPSLIIQGTTDFQVSKQDAEALVKAQKISRLAMIENMNHVLKIVKDPNPMAQMQGSYQDPALPLAPEFVKVIVEFVKGFK
jgi:pimeloyl-ACP methyl ester carboxylesterase